MGSRALSISRRVNARRQRTGLWTTLAKVRPRVDSSRGRTATPTSFNRVRMRAWWVSLYRASNSNRRIVLRFPSLRTAKTTRSKGRASPHNSSSRLNSKSSYSRFKWRGRTMDRSSLATKWSRACPKMASCTTPSLPQTRQTSRAEPPKSLESPKALEDTKLTLSRHNRCCRCPRTPTPSS